MDTIKRSDIVELIDQLMEEGNVLSLKQVAKRVADRFGSDDAEPASATTSAVSQAIKLLKEAAGTDDLATAISIVKARTAASTVPVITDVSKFAASTDRLAEIVHNGELATIQKTDSVRAVAKSDLDAGASAFSEIELTELWTDHAYRNRAFYKFAKGRSADQCFAALVTREPMVMKHIRLARMIGWQDHTRTLFKMAKAGPRVRGAAPDAPTSHPSAALIEPLLVDATPQMLGDDDAVHAADGGAGAAAAQIASIIEEKARAAPWMTPAQLQAYAEGMRLRIEAAQEAASGVKGRVGYPRRANRASTGPRI